MSTQQSLAGKKPATPPDITIADLGVLKSLLIFDATNNSSGLVSENLKWSSDWIVGDSFISYDWFLKLNRIDKADIKAFADTNLTDKITVTSTTNTVTKARDSAKFKLNYAIAHIGGTANGINDDYERTVVKAFSDYAYGSENKNIIKKDMNNITSLLIKQYEIKGLNSKKFSELVYYVWQYGINKDKGEFYTKNRRVLT